MPLPCKVQLHTVNTLTYSDDLQLFYWKQVHTNLLLCITVNQQILMPIIIHYQASLTLIEKMDYLHTKGPPLSPLQPLLIVFPASPAHNIASVTAHVPLSRRPAADVLSFLAHALFVTTGRSACCR